MVRIFKIILLCFFTIMMVWGCAIKESPNDNIFDKLTRNDSAIHIMNNTIGNFGDSKLVVFENEVYVIASLSGTLQIRKFDSSDSLFKLTSPKISSSWLAVIRDNNSILCITASGNDKSLRLYRIDIPTLNAELLSVVESKDQLLIDPTLIKVDDSYYITYTQIDGNVNNSDTTRQNGHYEVVLMKSQDLINWEKISSIVAANTNIEDGSIYYSTERKKFLFLYEEEIFDKKNSSLKIKQSVDQGKTWGDEVVLLSAEADQEPAGMFLQNHKWYLLYSSDIDSIGMSYYGAKGFTSTFNEFDFKPDLANVDIRLDSSIVLYDVKLFNNKLYFLAVKLNKSKKQLIQYLFE